MKAKGKMKNRIAVTVIIVAVVMAVIIGISIYNTPTNRINRHLDLGQKYLEEQNYEQALVEFDKAIAIDSMNVDAYIGKAQTCESIGDYESAIEAYYKLLDIDADDGSIADVLQESYLGLAEIYCLQDDKEKAIEILLSGFERTDEQVLFDRLWELGYRDIEYKIERMDDSIRDEDGNIRVNIYYDLVHLDSRKKSVQKINKYIEDVHYDNFLKNEGTKEQIQEMYVYDYPPTLEYPYFNTVDAEVTYQDENYISIKWTKKWFMGGVFNISYSGMVFSLETGEPVNLQDIYGFEPNITLAYLKFAVMEYMYDWDNSTYHSIASQACDIVSEYGIEDFSFYLDDGYPVLCFATYEIAAGAYGSFEIPCSASINKDSWQADEEMLNGRWVSGDNNNGIIYVLTFMENFQIEYVIGWGMLSGRDTPGDAFAIFQGAYDIKKWDADKKQGQVLLDTVDTLGDMGNYKGLFRVTCLGEDVIAINRIDGESILGLKDTENVLILGKAVRYY